MESLTEAAGRSGEPVLLDPLIGLLSHADQILDAAYRALPFGEFIRQNLAVAACVVCSLAAIRTATKFLHTEKAEIYYISAVSLAFSWALLIPYYQSVDVQHEELAAFSGLAMVFAGRLLLLQSSNGSELSNFLLRSSVYGLWMLVAYLMADFFPDSDLRELARLGVATLIICGGYFLVWRGIKEATNSNRLLLLITTILYISADITYSIHEGYTIVAGVEGHASRMPESLVLMFSLLKLLFTAQVISSMARTDLVEPISNFRLWLRIGIGEKLFFRHGLNFQGDPRTNNLEVSDGNVS